MICNRTASCFSDMLDEEKTLSCSSCLDSRHHGQTIVCRDRRSTEYRLSNPDRLTAAVLKIDGGVIQDNNEQKCDFAILLGKSGLTPTAVLVELKGGDTAHAVRQISSALELLNNTWNGYKVYGRIVGTRNPQLGSGGDRAYRCLNRRLMRMGGNLGYQRPRPDSVDSAKIKGTEIVLPKKEN